MDVRLTALLAASLAALALPQPYGHLAALSTLPLAARRIKWLSFDGRRLAAALAAYCAALALDAAVGPPPPRSVDVVQAVLLAPLAEEYVFRALAFAALPGPAAWAFATAAFGALHPANPPLAALYGLALALAYRGGGLAASAVLHAANNALWLAAYRGASYGAP